MKLKIVSDGTEMGTYVTTEDGENIENIREIRWFIKAGGLAIVTIKLPIMDVDVVGELEGHDVVDVPAVGETSRTTILVKKEDKP